MEAPSAGRENNPGTPSAYDVAVSPGEPPMGKIVMDIDWEGVLIVLCIIVAVVASRDWGNDVMPW